MKKIINLLILLLLISCSQEEVNKSDNNQTTSTDLNNRKENLSISFSEQNSEGVLIGDKISILDSSLKFKRDITKYRETFVEILAVSDSLFKANPNDDYCEEFKFVKIRTPEFEGLIDGRNVYQLTKSFQNKKVTLPGKELEIIATKYFGIGVGNEDGLTFCSAYTPAVIIDKSSGFKGLVKMVRNKYYKIEYPYFELLASDMAGDEILNITDNNGKYQLEIKREYQEGGVLLITELRKNDQGQYIAEILSEKVLE